MNTTNDPPAKDRRAQADGAPSVYPETLQFEENTSEFDF